MSRHLPGPAAIVFLAVILIISLVACGGGGGSDDVQPPSDFLLFYGDNTNTAGDGLFKIQDGVLWPVAIIDPAGRSEVQQFTALGEQTIFSACNISGCEPWVTDGTPEGTRLIKNINPAGDSNPGEFTLFNGEIYFSADDGQHGVELWKTDASEDGTVMVSNIAGENPAVPIIPVDSSPHELTVFNGALYFAADDGQRGVELWKTDGSEAGTVMVANIAGENPAAPGIPVDSSPHELTLFNGALYFAADDGQHGVELWKTDGSEAGTVMVANIAGENPAAPGIPVDSSPQQFTIFNNTLYFFADDGATGFEPWKSDGTPGGTVMVANIGDDSAGPFPATSANLTYWLAMNGRLFFTAENGATGVHPWFTDGTVTARLADINVAPGRDDVFRAFSSRLFFFADDGEHGFEPWLSDGTTEGTAMISDIYASPINLPVDADDLKVLTEYQGHLYFTANDGLTGREIWVSDGTAIGTTILKDIGPGFESGYSDAFGPLTLDGVLFFSAFDGGISGHGVEMWETRGTPAETLLVADLNPGVQDGVVKAAP